MSARPQRKCKTVTANFRDAESYESDFDAFESDVSAEKYGRNKNPMKVKQNMKRKFSTAKCFNEELDDEIIVPSEGNCCKYSSDSKTSSDTNSENVFTRNDSCYKRELGKKKMQSKLSENTHKVSYGSTTASVSGGSGAKTHTKENTKFHEKDALQTSNIRHRASSNVIIKRLTKLGNSRQNYQNVSKSTPNQGFYTESSSNSDHKKTESSDDENSVSLESKIPQTIRNSSSCSGSTSESNIKPKSRQNSKMNAPSTVSKFGKNEKMMKRKKPNGTQLQGRSPMKFSKSSISSSYGNGFHSNTESSFNDKSSSSISSEFENKKASKSPKRSRNTAKPKRSSKKIEQRDENDDDPGDQPTIHKILASKIQSSKLWRKEMEKMNTAEIKMGSIWNQPDSKDFDDDKIERFLVKWMRMSYLHVSWETAEDLVEILGVWGSNHIRRFKSGPPLLDDEDKGDGDYFDPLFTEIDRIIDTDEVKGLPTRYLIKWARLPYSESTYETVNDLEAFGLDYARAVKAHQLRERPVKKHVKLPQVGTGFSQLIFPNGGKLRSYQEEGVKWMLVNWAKGRSSILADEMGLGKTLQTAAFLWHLYRDMGKIGPYLVVAPLSTVVHWQREIENWTGLNTIIYHGSQDDRVVIETYEIFIQSKMNGKNNSVKGVSQFKPVVIVTTPDMVSKPDIQRVLSPMTFEMLIVDEAHRLKNDASIFTKLLAKGGRFNWNKCLLLTGTPLQNSTEELWTLLNFVDPEKFESKAKFSAQFGDMSQQSQVEALVQIMKIYVLRRMKEDVEKGVPPKQETLVEVELTSIQKQYYRALYEQNTQFLLRGGKRKAADRPSLINLAMELRKCCNHPYLIKGAELTIGEENRIGKKGEQKAEAVENLVACSGKLVLLDKLLPRLKEQGHRVLIFSQFKIMLNILEDYLIGRKYNYGRIDGSITGQKRQRQIDNFQAENSPMFTMLLSTKAGGVGINLTAADTVIIFDSDWNPQNDLQAQARCHRIGQTKSVRVFRLITRKTYEQVMFQVASKKLGLDRAVLSQGRANKAEVNIAVSEVEGLLRRGAYEAFKDDGTEIDSKVFCESDIDMILQRSQVITHDTEASKSGLDSNSFSKASFQANGTTGEAVDIDDPDFWTKVVGLTMPEVTEQPLPRRAAAKGKKNYSEIGKVKNEAISEASLEASDDSSELTDSSTPRDSTMAKMKSRTQKINAKDLWQNMQSRGLDKWNDLALSLKRPSNNVEEVERIGRSMLAQVVLQSIRDLYTTSIQKPGVHDGVNPPPTVLDDSSDAEREKKVWYLRSIYSIMKTHPSARYVIRIPQGTKISDETPEIQRMYEALKSIPISEEIRKAPFLENMKRPRQKLHLFDDLIDCTRLLKMIEKATSVTDGDVNVWKGIIENIPSSQNNWNINEDLFLLRSVEYHGWPSRRTLQMSTEDSRLSWLKPPNVAHSVFNTVMPLTFKVSTASLNSASNDTEAHVLSAVKTEGAILKNEHGKLADDVLNNHPNPEIQKVEVGSSSHDPPIKSNTSNVELQGSCDLLEDAENIPENTISKPTDTETMVSKNDTCLVSYPQVPQMLKRLKVLLNALHKAESPPIDTSIVKVISNQKKPVDLKVVAQPKQMNIEGLIRLAIMSYGVPISTLKRNNDNSGVISGIHSAGGVFLKNLLNLTWHDLAKYSGTQDVQFVQKVSYELIISALHQTGATSTDFAVNFDPKTSSVCMFNFMPAPQEDPHAFLQYVIRATETRYALFCHASSVTEITSLASRLSRSLPAAPTGLSWWAPFLHDASLLVHSSLHGTSDAGIKNIILGRQFGDAVLLDFKPGTNIPVLPWRTSTPNLLPLAHYTPPLAAAEAGKRLRALQNLIVARVSQDSNGSCMPPHLSVPMQESMKMEIQIAHKSLPQMSPTNNNLIVNSVSAGIDAGEAKLENICRANLPWRKSPSKKEVVAALSPPNVVFEGVNTEEITASSKEIPDRPWRQMQVISGPTGSLQNNLGTPKITSFFTKKDE